MKRYMLFTLLFMLYLSFCFSEDKEIQLFFVENNQQNFYKIFLNINKIDYIEDGPFITLNCNLDFLRKILQIEKLKMDVIKDNIENEFTTRTAAGTPYHKLCVDITSTGEIIVKENIEILERNVYDPVHPDANKEGPFKGYVAYPNIDIIAEYNDLNNSIYLYNSIVDYIQRNNLDILIEKMPMNPIEIIKHLRTIERNIRVHSYLQIQNKN